MNSLIKLSTVFLTLAAVFVSAGCVTVLHGERTELIRVTPYDGGYTEISFKLNKDYIRILEEEAAKAPADAKEPTKAQEDLKRIRKITELDPEKYQRELDQDFMWAYESGFYITSREIDVKTLSFTYKGYFEQRSFLETYDPASHVFSSVDIPSMPYFFIESAWRSGGRRVHVNTRTGDESTLEILHILQIPGVYEEEEKEDSIISPSRMRKYGNIRIVRRYESYGKIKEIEGFRRDGEAAILEFDYKRLLEDEEYNKQFLEVVEKGFCTVNFAEPKGKEAEIAKHRKLLHKAKVKATERYLELLKKYSPEEPAEEDADNDIEPGTEPGKEDGE